MPWQAVRTEQPMASGASGQLAQVFGHPQDPIAYASYFEAWSAADVEREFTGLDIPIRVVVGENDLAVTPELMEGTFVKLQPATELKTYAGCGHYAMIESPLRLAAEIQGFFGG